MRNTATVHIERTVSFRLSDQIVWQRATQLTACHLQRGDDMLSVGFQRYLSHPVLWVLREIGLKLGNTQGKTDDSCYWRKRPSEKATRLESAIEGMTPTLCLLLASLKDAENYVRMI